MVKIKWFVVNYAYSVTYFQQIYYHKNMKTSEWISILHPEAATQRRSEKKVFWKYAANLQENAHAEVWFQNHTLAWVFSCKIAAYFQNTFY